ncbi:MAG: hypothetical protein ACWA41_12780 [Putridiphycobacter sp.]
MALDAFADYLFKSMVVSMFKNDDEVFSTLISIFNGINENYNRNIHPQSTTYIVHLLVPFHPIFKAMIMNKDNLIYNPDKFKQEFKPVFNEIH